MIPLINTEKEFDSMPYNLMKNTSLNNINNNIWGQIWGKYKEKQENYKVQSSGLWLSLLKEGKE